MGYTHTPRHASARVTKNKKRIKIHDRANMLSRAVPFARRAAASVPRRHMASKIDNSSPSMGPVAVVSAVTGVLIGVFGYDLLGPSEAQIMGSSESLAKEQRRRIHQLTKEQGEAA